MTLDKQREVWYYNKALDSCITCGGVAHLGERLNGIQEVRGSIPLISTTENPLKQTFKRVFYLLFAGVLCHIRKVATLLTIYIFQRCNRCKFFHADSIFFLERHGHRYPL